MENLKELIYEFSRDPDTEITEEKALLLKPYVSMVDRELLERAKGWKEGYKGFFTPTYVVYAKIFWMLTGSSEFLDEDLEIWGMKKKKDKNIFEEIFTRIASDPLKRTNENKAIRSILTDYEVGMKFSSSVKSFILKEKEITSQKEKIVERESLRHHLIKLAGRGKPITPIAQTRKN